jgi:hypothetical protein
MRSGESRRTAANRNLPSLLCVHDTALSPFGAALHREPNGGKLRLEASLTPRQRELPVSLFLSGLPVWAAAILLVIAPTIAAMCGPVLTRRRVGLERLTSNNEIAGFKFATVGVIYAVLMAFAVIVAWEKFSEAEIAVVKEAGASATLYRLARGPEPEAVTTRAALDNYLRLAIDRDWPSMEKAKASREVTLALNALYANAIHLMDNKSRPPEIFGEMLKQLDTITQARRARLHLSTGIVPKLLCGWSYIAAQYSPWGSRSFSAPRTCRPR